MPETLFETFRYKAVVALLCCAMRCNAMQGCLGNASQCIVQQGCLGVVLLRKALPCSAMRFKAV